MGPYSDSGRRSALPAGGTTSVPPDVDEVCRLTATVGAAAAVADSATTYVGLRWLGTVEGSPAVQSMIDALGLGAGLTLRTVAAVALLAVVWSGTRGWPRAVGLASVAGVYCWVVGWNLNVMYG